MQVLAASVLASALLFASAATPPASVAKPPAEPSKLTSSATPEEFTSQCFADISVPTGREQRHNFGDGMWGKAAPLTDVSQQPGTMKHQTCSEDRFSEMTPGDTRELFGLLDLAEGDKLAEIGSSSGNMAVRAVALTGVQHAESIISQEDRHSACEGLKALQNQVPRVVAGQKSTSRVALKPGHFMTANISDYTVVLANSQCFRKGALEKLAQKLASELPQGARIASTQAFRELPPRLAQTTRTPLKMGSVLVSVYEVEGPVSPKVHHSLLRMSKRTMEQRESAVKKHESARNGKKHNKHRAPKKDIERRETGMWPVPKHLRHAAVNMTADAK